MNILIGKRPFQKFLKLKGYYNGVIDGIIGNKTQTAARRLVEDYRARFYGADKRGIGQRADWGTAAQQILFKELQLYSGQIDGYHGPNTAYALEQYQNLMRDLDAAEDEVSTTNSQWPLYDNMEDFYGAVGSDMVQVRLPYTMQLAWDNSVSVNRITIHRRCAQSAMGIMETARDAYGGPAAMSELCLDQFGGCLHVRKMRGGSRYSTHSWGAAIDFDPARNQFRWTDVRASLDGSEYDKWWELWEAEGWVSLGRERNFDWMHVQAVRL